MANFDSAYARTAVFEGGYADNPADKGGETYKGISRKYHPKWAGWLIIDVAKATNPETFRVVLDSNKALSQLVKDFFREFFWDPFWGDSFSDQALAEKLYDISVNMAPRRAVLFLQQSLNLLNRNQRTYADLVVDGSFGSKTLDTLKAFLRLENSKYLLVLINNFQGHHYIKQATENSDQEIFMRGWLRRVLCEDNFHEAVDNDVSELVQKQKAEISLLEEQIRYLKDQFYLVFRTAEKCVS